MRACFIALMIALLPLRGWVGGEMAAEMAFPPTQATTHAMQRAASHPDCALHAAVAGMSATPDDGTDPGSGCTACQMCHALAMEAPPSRQAVEALPWRTVPVAASNFASADRALSVKPPIA